MVRDVSLSGEILTTLHGIVLCGNDRMMIRGIAGKVARASRSATGLRWCSCMMRWWVAVEWIEELFTVGEQRVGELESVTVFPGPQSLLT